MFNCKRGDTKEWKDVFDVNVLGLCVATREAVRDMKKNGVNGHIIHINSVSGHRVASHATSVYAASKFAVTALTETLRQELVAQGSKIKITSISPGYVETEFASTSGIDASPAMKEFFKNVKGLDAEDIADRKSVV